MPLDKFSATFHVKSRQEIVARYLKDYLFRQPGARTGPGSVPYVDAHVLADALLPLYADAAAVADDVGLADKTYAGLAAELERIGAPPPFPDIGASGFVTIAASTGGGTLFEGDEIKDEVTGLRFQCTTTALYTNGSQVPVQGRDTGLETNLAAGTVLKWTNPRPGIFARATITATATGKGLEGGRAAETAPELVLRIQSTKADPPAAGNDAQIRKFVTETPGVPVQEVFTYPGADGPATTAYAVTLAPSTVGASRSPTSIQLADTRAHLIGRLPKDDAPIDVLTLEVPVDLMLRIRWQKKAKGWVDSVPWPPYIGGGVTNGTVTVVTSENVFRIQTTTPPQTGATFAFFDAITGKFRRKRVLTATPFGGTSMDVVCDTTNNASDASFLPVVGAIPCPWSESLDELVLPVLEAFGGLGPGEMFDPFFDEGFRQKRNPESPVTWTSELGTRAFGGIDDLPVVSSATIVYPTIPYATPVGVANVSVNLLVLGKLSAFPL